MEGGSKKISDELNNFHGHKNFIFHFVSIFCLASKMNNEIIKAKHKLCSLIPKMELPRLKIFKISKEILRNLNVDSLL